jgi:LysR substrate binding domain
MQTVLALVEAGEGVALVPACVANLRARDVVWRPVEPDSARIPLAMVWPVARERPVLQSFLDLVASMPIPSERWAQAPPRADPPGVRRGRHPHSSDFISVMSLVRLSLASPKSIMHFSS